MKNTVITLFCFVLGTFGHAQVAIGKNSVSSPSASLEFGSGNRGLILPWVTSAANVVSPVNGTFIFDASDKKVKLRSANQWQDLSVDTTGVVNTSIQTSRTENPASRVVIGKNPASETANGVLILSDTNKAMVLPKVPSPHLNIVTPSPGMMVYDTTARMVAFYNGTVWSYWKP